MTTSTATATRHVGAAERVQYCTFSVAGLFFGVGADQVLEVIRELPITPAPRAPHDIRGLINLRGQIVAAIDLRRRLGLPEATDQESTVNIVLQDGEGAVSLVVDEIGDVVEVEAGSVLPPPSTLRSPVRDLVSGVHQLDGKLLLILNTDRAVAA